VRRESGDSLERDTGDDLGQQMESIVIKVYLLLHFSIRILFSLLEKLKVEP